MPVKVLLIAPSMAIVGGQSIQADRLMRAFRGNDRVRIHFCPIDPKLPGRLRQIPYLRTIGNAAVYYGALVNGIRRSNIIHAFTSSFWGYTLWIIPAVLLSRLTSRKIVVNYRDGRAEAHLRTWRSAVATLRLTDAIVVPSSYLVDVFEQFGLTASVIPNAIDMSTFCYRKRDVIRPTFLTNRGLEPLYNVDLTIRAFRLIQDRYPQARFVVANDGPLRPHLESLARELKLANTTFTGAVSQQKMAELYNAADIYVMSPKIDNMPGTVLECFASGLPVVSTASGGVPYIAQHERNALLSPHEASPEQLADNCFRLIEENGLGLRLAAEGYRDCLERYSTDSVRDQWSRFYMTMLNGKQKAGNNSR